jgi:hypothetical protein
MTRKQSPSYVARYPWPGNLDIAMMARRLPAQSRVSFEQLEILGAAVRLLFFERQISIRPLSGLAKLLDHIDVSASEWRNGTGQSVDAMIYATTAMRVVESILGAKDERAADACYRRIAKKT